MRSRDKRPAKPWRRGADRRDKAAETDFKRPVGDMSDFVESKRCPVLDECEKPRHPECVH